MKYLKKSFGKITALETPAKEFYVATEGYEAIVNISLTNKDSTEVFRAEIKMWVSNKS